VTVNDALRPASIDRTSFGPGTFDVLEPGVYDVIAWLSKLTTPPNSAVKANPDHSNPASPSRDGRVNSV
jgi:hypothetical protein